MKEVGIRGFYPDREDTLACLKDSGEFLHKDRFEVSRESSLYKNPVERALAKYQETLATRNRDDLGDYGSSLLLIPLMPLNKQ